MLVIELLESIKDFRNPDDLPGAVEREGSARSSLLQRQHAAAEELNKMSKRYKLGCEFTVGEYIGMAGQFIKTSSSTGAVLKGTSAKVGWIRVDTNNGDDLIMDLKHEGITISKEDLKTLNDRARKDLDLISYRNFLTIRKNELTIIFGSASSVFSDPKKAKAARKLLDEIIKLISQ